MFYKLQSLSKATNESKPASLLSLSTFLPQTLLSLPFPPHWILSSLPHKSFRPFSLTARMSDQIKEESTHDERIEWIVKWIKGWMDESINHSMKEWMTE